MFYDEIYRLNVRPEITRGEIRRLWDTFITTQHRTLDFMEFVRHFGYSPKSAAFPNAKLAPPKRGDSDFLIRSRKLNCAADMLEDNLRSKVGSSVHTSGTCFTKPFCNDRWQKSVTNPLITNQKQGFQLLITKTIICHWWHVLWNGAQARFCNVKQSWI